MDSNNKKYNKLSIIAFVLVIAGFLIIDRFLSSVGGLLVLSGFILGIVSYFEIRKTGEKGKGFLITILVLFILIIISMALLYLPIKSFKTTRTTNILEDRSEQDFLNKKVDVERAKFEIKLLILDNNWSEALITSSNIYSVDIINDNGLKTVQITLDEEGKQILKKITSENVGKKLGLFVDNESMSIPVIKEKIALGQIEISGLSDFSDEEILGFKARLLGYYYE